MTALCLVHLMKPETSDSEQKFCCLRLAPLTSCPRDEDGQSTVMTPPPWPTLHDCEGQAEHVHTRPLLRASAAGLLAGKGGSLGLSDMQPCP